MSRPDLVFSALASPVRRETLLLLKDRPWSAGELADYFGISAPSMSRHLAVLKAAELVSEAREGNRIFYSVESEELAHSVGAFLSAVCPTQILGRRNRPAPEESP
jgi:DNA-binding transcriptional ArsR family regulator